MKSYLILIIILLVITGCRSDENLSSNENDNKEYIIELESQITQLQENLANQKEEISNLLNAENEYNIITDEKDEDILQLKRQLDEVLQSQITLDESQKKFLEYYDSFYPGNIYWGEAGARIMIKVNYSEPLRISPSELSPYVVTRELTYSEVIDESQVVDAEFLYLSMGETGEHWCLVVINNMVGYVKESSVVEYSYKDRWYEPSEQFHELKLGITVEEVVELFGDKIQHVDSPNSYSKVLYISFEGLPYREDTGESVSYSYNPNTRIVDYICVNTDDYVMESGYKVGDSLEEVYGYYDNLYPNITEEYYIVGFSEKDRIYDIGNGFTLEIKGKDGKVLQIIINHGYNIYT